MNKETRKMKKVIKRRVIRKGHLKNEIDKKRASKNKALGKKKVKKVKKIKKIIKE